MRKTDFAAVTEHCTAETSLNVDEQSLLVRRAIFTPIEDVNLKSRPRWRYYLNREFGELAVGEDVLKMKLSVLLRCSGCVNRALRFLSEFARSTDSYNQASTQRIDVAAVEGVDVEGDRTIGTPLNSCLEREDVRVVIRLPEARGQLCLRLVQPIPSHFQFVSGLLYLTQKVCVVCSCGEV